jgi:sulfur carrier protein
VIEVHVNGAAKRFESDTDVAALLERLQLAGKRVAVERNGEIVPRSRFAHTALANGDRLEIVVAGGGGGAWRRPISTAPG